MLRVAEPDTKQVVLIRALFGNASEDIALGGFVAVSGCTDGRKYLPGRRRKLWIPTPRALQRTRKNSFLRPAWIGLQFAAAEKQGRASQDFRMRGHFFRVKYVAALYGPPDTTSGIG